MTDKEPSKGNSNWIPIIVALIGAVSATTVGYWQYSQSQNGGRYFAGRVVDANTESSIRGAKITLEIQGAPPVMYTDSEGVFSFTIQDPGSSIRLRVDAEGYGKFDRLIDISSKKGIEEIRLFPQQEEVAPDPKPSSNTNNELLQDQDLIELGTLLRNIATLSKVKLEYNASWNELRSLSAPTRWRTDYPQFNDIESQTQWLGEVFVRLNKFADLDATGRLPAVWFVKGIGARSMVFEVFISREQPLSTDIERFEGDLLKSMRRNFQKFELVCQQERYSYEWPEKIFEAKFDDLSVPIVLSYSSGSGGTWPILNIMLDSFEADLICS